MALDLYSAAIVSVALVLAGAIAIKTKISSSIFEVASGVFLANLLSINITHWLDFLGTFGGLVLTFLAGAEVDFLLLKREAKKSFVIGGMAFLCPFVGLLGITSFFGEWGLACLLRIVGSLRFKVSTILRIFSTRFLLA